MGKNASKFLPQAKYDLGDTAPFLAFIIGPVGRYNNPIPKKPGKGREQRRTYGMDVHYIRFVFISYYQGEEGMDNGLNALLMGCIAMDEFYAAPFFRSLFDVETPRAENDFVSPGNDAGVKLFAVLLDASGNVGNSSYPCDKYFHGTV
jgi:hypothetical protein